MRVTGPALLLGLLLVAAPGLAADDAGIAAGPLPVDAFGRLEKGMGEQQVLAVAGLPSSEGTYRPRLDRVLGVIGLGDDYRTYFYRGMGRVLFVGGSQLVQNGTVAKIEIDSDEPGTGGQRVAPLVPDDQGRTPSAAPSTAK